MEDCYTEKQILIWEENMKTRKEVEEYLRDLEIEIKSYMEDRSSTEYGAETIQTERIMPITGEKVIEDNLKHDKIKVLNNDAKNALLDLISQSMTSGDMETAKTALEVLQEQLNIIWMQIFKKFCMQCIIYIG